MRLSRPSLLFALMLLAVLPLCFAQQSSPTVHKHHKYKVIDLGTLGGPNSWQVSPGRSSNSRGAAITFSDTAVPDPNSPNCLTNDCFIDHAIVWNKDSIRDLGTLAGVDPALNNSLAFWISDNGWIAGLSENGAIDSLTNFPQVRAALWKQHGPALDLGTLGGNSSQAFAVNNSKQVVGVALNHKPDDFAQFMNFLPAATQARAFLWQGGSMHDLGTLGGNDSNAQAINDRGQVVGFSFTDTTVNSFFGVPTVHPFLWERGTMIDLGSLGGTVALPGSIYAPGGVTLNNKGQVVGTSTLTGDLVWHPFLWENGSLRDLGTLGGEDAEAFSISESGYVAGSSYVSPTANTYHAFRWQNGAMLDLGVFPPCDSSVALSVNSKGQSVGETQICPGGADGDAFLSENGEQIVDLNSLVVPGSGLRLTSGAYINDRGEIVGLGIFPDGDQRGILLIPCDHFHPDVDGCDYSELEITGAQSVSAWASNRLSQIPARSSTEPGRDELNHQIVGHDLARSRGLWRRRLRPMPRSPWSF